MTDIVCPIEYRIVTWILNEIRWDSRLVGEDALPLSPSRLVAHAARAEDFLIVPAGIDPADETTVAWQAAKRARDVYALKYVPAQTREIINGTL